MSVMPCLYLASESNKGQDGYDIGFNSSNTLTSNLLGIVVVRKDQLPPSNINLLEQHIVRVKKLSRFSVCILHMLCGCKLLDAVNDHPTSHIEATDNLKDDYLKNQ